MDPVSLIERFAERFEAPEALDYEIKSGKGGLPKDLWPTISAFANTAGGWILLGIEVADGQNKLVGVPKPNTRMKELFDLMRNENKISHPVCGPDDVSIETPAGKSILLIRVPAVSRKSKPVYVNGNPYRGTYLRRHSGDYRCTKPEVDRMMREASEPGADSTIVSELSINDLDQDAIARYRRRFQTRDPAHPWNAHSTERFLEAIGATRRDRSTGQEGVTVAGLLLLGGATDILNWRTRHLIDFRALPSNDDSASDRWDDRVVWEGNLLGAFEALFPRLTADLPVEFKLRNGARVDESPVHVAVREALVNLLVHADYTEAQASIVSRSSEGFLFRNPGSSRVPENDLFSGDRSDPRNPLLVRMFRFIGLAEEAGTGIVQILRLWRGLGLQTPRIDTGTERYEFALELRYAHLFSDADRAWLQSLGTEWNEAEQLALVVARHEGKVDNFTLRRLTGQHPSDATKTLTGLRDRKFLNIVGSGKGTHYELGEEAKLSQGELGLAERLVDSVSGLVDTGQSLAGSLPELERIAEPARTKKRLAQSRLHEIIVALCAVEALSIRDLAELLERSEGYVRAEVRQLLNGGQLAFLHPERPNHPHQRYVTKDGVRH